MCENTYVNIQTGEVLDMEKVSILKDNAILKIRPELFIEWDYEKNNELGLNIYNATKGSQKNAWWICIKCMSSYDANFNNRFNNSKCPYCTGKKANQTNSLASLRPDLAKQWHPTKNRKLTPFDVTHKSNKKVWWMGKCGHEWDTIVRHRSKGTDCPYCSNVITLKGFNDMWVTNPELASLLANPEDGYKYMQNSHKKLDWKCPKCKEIVKNKAIRSINNQGLSCLKCVDGKSYPEKILTNVLNELDIEYENEKTFKWSKGKRFDFLLSINSSSIIIEIHGAQHSVDRGFERTGGRTIEEEQANDKFKEELAKENGIEHYIVIDARYSDFEYIKNNILDSELSKLINLNEINWTKINNLSESSIVKIVCDLWNDGFKSIKLICEKSNLNRNTVSRYLKRGNLLGWCDYKNINGAEYTKRKVVRMSLDGNVVVKYSSITDAKIKNNFKHHSGISRVCRGITKSYKNYLWMYLEDYEKQYGKIDE